MKFTEYGQVMTKAYKDLMAGLATNNKEGRRKHMEPILTDLGLLKSRAGEHLKSDVSMFKADVKQLSEVVSAQSVLWNTPTLTNVLPDYYYDHGSPQHSNRRTCGIYRARSNRTMTFGCLLEFRDCEDPH